MILFADLAVPPYGLVTWAVLGLLPGAFAAWGRNRWIGRLLDVCFGVAGALAGGLLFSFSREFNTPGTGVTGFWPSIPPALLGALAVLGLGRVLTFGRRT